MARQLSAAQQAELDQLNGNAPVAVTKPTLTAAALAELDQLNAPAVPTREKTSALDAAKLHVAQGATGGFVPALTGLVAAVGSKLGLGPEPVAPATTRDGRSIDATKLSAVGKRIATNPDLQPGDPRFIDVYRDARDATTELVDHTREDHPVIATGAEIVGAVSSPINKVGGAAMKLVPAAAKGAGAAKAIAATAAKAAIGAAAEGAIYSAGNSRADLTRGEVGKFAKDVAVGTAADAAVGGTLAAGVKAGKMALSRRAYLKHIAEMAKAEPAAFDGETKEQIFKRLATENPPEAFASEKALEQLTEAEDRLGERITNEVAEGTNPTSKATTPTQRKHLSKATKPITDEVVDGPDAKAVRDAYLSGPKSGLKKLQKVLDPIQEANERNYAKFQEHGRHLVDTAAYAKHLDDSITEAYTKGKVEDAELLKVVKGKFQEMIDGTTTPMDLPRLRGFTTEVQEVAASAVGGLNLHRGAALKARASALVTKQMGKVLSDAAKGDKVLEQAATNITANNKRFNGLLTIKKALELRLYKEQTGTSPIRTAVELASGAGLSAGAGYAFSGDENKAGNAVLLGAAGLAAGKAGRAAMRVGDRALTTRAINQFNEGAKQAADVGAEAVLDARTATRSKDVARALAPAISRLVSGAKSGEDETELRTAAKAAGLTDQEIDQVLAAARTRRTGTSRGS